MIKWMYYQAIVSWMNVYEANESACVLLLEFCRVRLVIPPLVSIYGSFQVFIS